MRFQFALPAYAALSGGTSILMISVFVVLSNWLGFTHCWSWTPLQKPPRGATRIVDSYADRIYVQATDMGIYCYEQGHWLDCLRSPFSPELHSAPDWLVARFISVPVSGKVLQLVRVNHFLNPIYYALSDSGTVLSCSTTFEAEIRNMSRSGAIALILIPLGLSFWSFMIFMKIFAQEANPVFSEFSGRRTRIK